MHMHGHTMPHPGWKCVEPPSDLQAIGLNMAGLDSAVGAGCDSAHGTLGSSHRSNHRRWELLTKDSIESSATMCYCSSGPWDTLRILVKPWFARSKTICMLIETNSLSSQLISALGSLRPWKDGTNQVVPCRLCFSHQPCCRNRWLRRISKDRGGQVWAGGLSWYMSRSKLENSELVIPIIPRISLEGFKT